MKRLLFLPLVCLLLVSCEGEQGPKGDKGDKGDDGTANWKIIDLEASSWLYSNEANNNYFYADFDVPEITQYVYDYGMVHCYVEYNYGTTTATQQLLPYSRHKEVEITQDDGTTQWVFYTETVDYDFGVGTLRIYYTQSDFDYELDTSFAPSAMHFRLAVIW